MPGSASPFEASRDIHTIAENVIVVDDVVTLVDADGNSMRRLAETAVFCPVAPCWTATAQRIARGRPHRLSVAIARRFRLTRFEPLVPQVQHF